MSVLSDFADTAFLIEEQNERKLNIDRLKVMSPRVKRRYSTNERIAIR